MDTERTMYLNLATSGVAVIPGRVEAAAFAAGMLQGRLQAVVHPLETAFVTPHTGATVAWFPVPLACLRAQPGGRLWAGADANHLCLLLVEDAKGQVEARPA